MLREEDVRKKVKALKRFYIDLINYAFLNGILILIWLIFDKTGTFWPKYVLLVWGIVLILRAFRLGIVPIMFHRVSFLSEKWEEKKIKEILYRQNIQKKHPIGKNKKKK